MKLNLLAFVLMINAGQVAIAGNLVRYAWRRTHATGRYVTWSLSLSVAAAFFAAYSTAIVTLTMPQITS